MRFISADSIFNGRDFMPDTVILVLNDSGDFVEFVDERQVDSTQVKHYAGILCPGFINAHCHLELSHLVGKIKPGAGLPGFAKEVITQRNSSTEANMESSMKSADNYMFENGIVAVGDISNTTHSLEIKKTSRLFYHTFVELIGLAPQRSETVFQSGLTLLTEFTSANLSASLAAHAPYSVSNELIQLIVDFNLKSGRVFSIHNQESEEETKFFMGEKSGFNALYDFLKLDISWFKAPGKSSLANYSQLLPNERALLVHNTFTTSNDLNLVKQKNSYWCFCPGANLYIENKLPDYGIFKHHKNYTCFGTDSLASNTRLNLLAEANLVLKATSVFNLVDALAMLTINGARALGIDDRYGQFIAGKNTGLNRLEFKNSELHFTQKIT